jgi:Fe-S-cluster-containing dehydrogenase component
MSKVFLIDIDRCNGCRNCQIACKDEHCEQAWLPYADAQPLTGHFWMNVVEKVRGQVPVVNISYTPTLCTHCADAPCMAVAPDAVYRREDGFVIIDPAKAKGLTELVDACPLGAIYYNETLDMAQKCTGCTHLLDNGWEIPRCVDSCATDALLYVDESEVDKTRAVTLEATSDLGPKVYYYNLPKRFVAGMVVDLGVDEVVAGAEVLLYAADNTLVATKRTDEFGDYRFNQVEAGVYTVVIHAESTQEIMLTADLSAQDLYLGDTDISSR